MIVPQSIHLDEPDPPPPAPPPPPSSVTSADSTRDTAAPEVGVLQQLSDPQHHLPPSFLQTALPPPSTHPEPFSHPYLHPPACKSARTSSTTITIASSSSASSSSSSSSFCPGNKNTSPTTTTTTTTTTTPVIIGTPNTSTSSSSSSSSSSSGVSSMTAGGVNPSSYSLTTSSSSSSSSSSSTTQPPSSSQDYRCRGRDEGGVVEGGGSGGVGGGTRGGGGGREEGVLITLSMAGEGGLVKELDKIHICSTTTTPISISTNTTTTSSSSSSSSQHSSSSAVSSMPSSSSSSSSSSKHSSSSSVLSSMPSSSYSTSSSSSSSSYGKAHTSQKEDLSMKPPFRSAAWRGGGGVGGGAHWIWRSHQQLKPADAPKKNDHPTTTTILKKEHPPTQPQALAGSHPKVTRQCNSSSMEVDEAPSKSSDHQSSSSSSEYSSCEPRSVTNTYHGGVSSNHHMSQSCKVSSSLSSDNNNSNSSRSNNVGQQQQEQQQQRQQLEDKEEIRRDEATRRRCFQNSATTTSILNCHHVSFDLDDTPLELLDADEREKKGGAKGERWEEKKRMMKRFGKRMLPKPLRRSQSAGCAKDVPAHALFLQYRLGEKGLDTILHKSCRQNYCNINVIQRDLKRQLEENNNQQDQPALRSKKAKFDISTDCLFCGLSAKNSQKRGDTVYPIRSLSFQSQIEHHCLMRGPDDKWDEAVLARIKSVNDLPAADALYHKQCSVNFRTTRGIPQAYQPSSETAKAAKGRPADERRTEALKKVVEYFKEFDDEQITLTDLCTKMKDYLDSDTQAYTEKHMRQKLESHFGDEIMITCIKGKRNVVTFRTLDGTGTFHGMGIIGAAIPGTKECRAVRRDTSVTPDRISALGRVPVHFYNPSSVDLSLVYEIMQDFAVEDRTRKLDLLWKVSWPLRSPRLGWSGMMQTICSGAYPGKSSFTFLPMIDMDPTNMSCIFSTLHFVSSVASRYDCTPVLTFDQPLWWRSTMIIDEEPPNSPLCSIVLRLGGFHCQMSFLGCIGRLMAGSGLKQVLEVAFASNSVIHMLSRKSVSRVV
ncbi:hypothetical protein ACOMHN_046303 [Nucella lapillus]